MIDIGKRAEAWLRGSAFAAAALFAGCTTTTPGSGVTASDPSRMTPSGFLSDYKRLQPATWSDGIQCWRDTTVDERKYDKVLLARMVVTLKDDHSTGVDPTDLKALTDYFHEALAKALKPQM